MSDQPGLRSATRAREKDILGRRALATALAEQLYWHAVGPKDIDPGPTVVTIEGPWGCGKSTLMDLVREQLPHPPRSIQPARRLTVRQASRLLRDGPGGTGTDDRAAQQPRGVVTAWFNPWAHQSGEQVWAGLVAEIIEAAQSVLYPTEATRERYWFVRNLTRVDRFALRRTLHRRTLSPELTLGALGVVASLAIAVAELETTVDVAGARIPTALMALLLSGTFLVIGAAHTVWRYFRSAAARFLPGELFHGPVNSTVAPDADPAGSGVPEGLADPLRRARAGSLYLHQHDVSELVADLDQAGYELVVFVDDLDRCRALTTAEVFEAINLFLAGFVSERRGTGRESPGDPGSSLRARFVIGLDPVVVAGHLDRVYADLYEPEEGLDGDDPSPGWAFLRKLVHLPVVVPQVSGEEMSRFLDQLIGFDRPAGLDQPTRTANSAGAGGPVAVAPRPAEWPAAAVPTPAVPTPAVPPAETPGAGSPGVSRQRGDGAWMAVVHHPEVRDLIRARLAAQPDRSIRVAMRQLHLLRLYDRVMAAEQPLDEPAAALARIRQLVILAEIVTRWPAMQRFLHHRAGSRTGLQRLAAAATDDDDWQRAVVAVFADPVGNAHAVAGLRELLRDHDGPGVAQLATHLL